MRTFLITMPICTQHHTIIVAREAGEHSAGVEFRGDGYQQWTAGPGWEHPITPAQRLHDAMEGWHTCVLHAGGTLAIHELHPDFAAVAALYDATP